uniref:Uncharacterized protein n=1 Tax=Anguilla anguilla TaxID=7936 RepID=A0A0E9TW00_ANGAN
MPVLHLQSYQTALLGQSHQHVSRGNSFTVAPYWLPQNSDTFPLRSFT